MTWGAHGLHGGPLRRGMEKSSCEGGRASSYSKPTTYAVASCGRWSCRWLPSLEMHTNVEETQQHQSQVEQSITSRTYKLYTLNHLQNNRKTFNQEKRNPIWNFMDAPVGASNLQPPTFTGHTVGKFGQSSSHFFMLPFTQWLMSSMQNQNFVGMWLLEQNPFFEPM